MFALSGTGELYLIDLLATAGLQPEALCRAIRFSHKERSTLEVE